MNLGLQWKILKWQLPSPMGNRQQLWNWRETVAVRLEDESGRVGFGEIAPLPGFGGESITDAIRFLHRLGDSVSAAEIYDVGRQLPASAFGLSSAIHSLTAHPIKFKLANTAFLGDWQSAGDCLKTAMDAGFMHFKIKLGVTAVPKEIDTVFNLIAMMPEGGRLRLDANGGLDWAGLERWVECFSGNARIQFLEQPLSRSNTIRFFADLVSIYPVFPLALDESISSVADWRHVMDDCSWPGFAVIKPSLFGSYTACINAIKGKEKRVVVSSAFESPIGAHSLAVLAAESKVKPAVGMGVAGSIDRECLIAAEISENHFSSGSDVWCKF